MKKLVFAEKPSVAKEMARVLKATSKKNGYFEGKDYVITWALGHLATLKEPGDYDNKYKTWSMESLPIIPEKMYIKRLKQTTKQYKVVEYLMNRKDVSELIIATDAGREGELVARWTMLLAKFRKPFKRLWISSQTDKAIKDGFNNLKDGKEYDRLFYAAKARAEADWLIGLNLTRALTCHYNVQLSAGRVQTPTLAMIVNRENEIKNFKPKEYYEIKAEFDGFFAHWVNSKNNGRIFDREFADKLVDSLRKEEKVEVKSKTVKDKHEGAPLLYDLNELQREANIRYNFSAKKTLNLMQTLYERHKIVTYPRTDSRYITTDMLNTLPNVLAALPSSYGAITKEIDLKFAGKNKRLVNNSKVTDHHAIIPTDEKANYSKLSSDEIKIYELVTKRFLAILMKPYVYSKVKVELSIGKETFVAQGKAVKDLGWRKLINNIDEKVEELPMQNLKKDLNLALKGIKLQSGKTTPPSKYTEASLLAQMEKNNLGTPATRADIIEKIIGTFYIERNGKILQSTSKGKQLVDLVPDMIKSAELTAKWERRLENIAKGKENSKKFLEEIKVSARDLIKTVAASESNFKLDNLSKTKCPVCGKSMLKVKGKKGREMLVCQDRTCNHREEITRKGDFGIKVTKRDKIMNKKLINKYADNKEDTGLSLGDLLSKFMD